MTDADGQPVEILLVDDNPGDVRLMQRALSTSALLHHLTVASDGEEALDALHRRGHHTATPRPQLVLLDLNLPRKGGLAILEEMKRERGLRHIPVIVLSTSDAPRDVMAAYERQANAYVPKPTDLTQYPPVIAAITDFWFKIARLPERCPPS